jgi:uncharacterized protein
MNPIKPIFKEGIRRLEMNDLDGLIDLIAKVPQLKDYSSGDYSLLSKARDHNPEVMVLLLEAGVNPNLIDTTGSTLLMDFSSLGDVERASLLIKYGALLNVANFHGETAFSFACANSQMECAKLLYENGADINALIGASDSRPLDFAIQYASENFVEWLHSIGARSGHP